MEYLFFLNRVIFVWRLWVSIMYSQYMYAYVHILGINLFAFTRKESFSHRNVWKCEKRAFRWISIEFRQNTKNIVGSGLNFIFRSAEFYGTNNYSFKRMIFIFSKASYEKNIFLEKTIALIKRKYVRMYTHIHIVIDECSYYHFVQ